jgi:hypothetical protein
MTAIHQARDTDEQRNLGPVLRRAHEIWVEHSDSFLTPVMAPEASFWERWTAVRFLADEFAAQLGRECALLEELRAFLPAGVTDQLLQDGERIGQLQEYMDRVGRRWGTGQTVAATARQLLDSVRAWCADVEAAVWQVDPSILTAEARQAVDSIQRYADIHA